jgi:lipopolysaccharide/colanic/teichoic acid biosynthesis glycosyltransferase
MRVIDLIASMLGLVVLGPVLVAGVLVSRLSTGGTGIFRQERIGRGGESIHVLKLRTMRAGTSGTSVTAAGDSRITRAGVFLRATKLDEIPQLVNVLVGDMALVGPRPDVPGYADMLTGPDRVLLDVRPGITGLASLLLRDEEELLASATNPKTFNDDVLFPAKVALNLEWLRARTMLGDVSLVVRTVLPWRFQPAFAARAAELRSELLARG